MLSQPKRSGVSADSADNNRSLIIGLLCVILAVAYYAWWKGAMSPLPLQPEGRPIWMDMKTQRAQMRDGEILSVKVALELSKTQDPYVLSSYTKVFAALVEQVSGRMSRQELKSEDGLERFSIEIQRSLNDYLDDRDIGESRITGVVFEDLTVLP